MKNTTIIPLIIGLGILLLVPPSAGHMTQSVQSGKTLPTVNDLIISIIQQVHGAEFLIHEENLLKNGPRPTQSSPCVTAAQYIYQQFNATGLAVRYHRWENQGYISENVEATLNGTDHTSDSIYIICAHYDTVVVSPGADDDTSGTVAVILAAEILSRYQFNHTIKFVTFSGEEQGLLGSQIYAQEAAAQGWNITGVLNCDMISYANTTEGGSNLNVCQNIPSAWLYNYSITINTKYNDFIGPLTLHNDGLSTGSDHYYFWQNGYDAIFYHNYEPDPYYHSAQDTIEHNNLSYAVKNTRLILATLAGLAEIQSSPPERPILTGPSIGIINGIYTYDATSTDPENEDIFYYFDWGDGTTTGWLGPYPSGQHITAEKSWTAAGTYLIQVQARDINQITSEWSVPLMMTILPNHPPQAPTIQGPTEGKPGNTYLFTFTTADPDGDLLWYSINWGDGQVSEWIGPYNSGETAITTHQWTEQGTYLIKAQAKDIHDAIGDYGSLSVTMPLNISSQQSTPFMFIRLTKIMF
jgi:Peptidase family M28/PKD domain